MFSPPPPPAPEEFEPWVPEHSKNLCSSLSMLEENIKARGSSSHQASSPAQSLALRRPTQPAQPDILERCVSRV